jgi:hypothetical protein
MKNQRTKISQISTCTSQTTASTSIMKTSSKENTVKREKLGTSEAFRQFSRFFNPKE